MSSKMLEFSISSAIIYILTAISFTGVAGYVYNKFDSAYSIESYSCLYTLEDILNQIGYGGYAIVNLNNIPPGWSLGFDSNLIWLKAGKQTFSLQFSTLQGNFTINSAGVYNFTLKDGKLEVYKIG